MIRAILLLALFVGAPRAEEPWLPRIAASLAAQKGWKIDLLWTVRAAQGGLAGDRTTEGVLLLAQDNRFRFTSSAMEALSDGTTAWQYSPATGQVLMQSVARLDPAQLPGTLLKQALSGAETSATRETLEGRKVVRLALAVGSGALAKYSAATVWADPSSLRPLRIEVRDAQGSTTTWDLKRWTRWKPGSGDFLWKAPAGSETVDLRD